MDNDWHEALQYFDKENAGDGGVGSCTSSDRTAQRSAARQRRYAEHVGILLTHIFLSSPGIEIEDHGISRTCLAEK